MNVMINQSEFSQGYVKNQAHKPGLVSFELLFTNEAASPGGEVGRDATTEQLSEAGGWRREAFYF